MRCYSVVTVSKLPVTTRGRSTRVVVVPSRHREESLSAIDIAVYARPRNAEGLRRVAQVRDTLSPQVERHAASKGMRASRKS